MIAGTYLLSALLLAVSAWLFDQNHLTAESQTFVWVVICFFASAGASAAYLTVSETWPIEIRAEAIAVFFAIAQIAGAFGLAIYGALIGTGTDRTGLFIGYLLGAGIMAIGGVIELVFGIKAEGKSLEDVTEPLTAVAEEARKPCPPEPMAARAESGVVYAAGAAQGIVLVTFPAASTIFTSPDEYDLSRRRPA